MNKSKTVMKKTRSVAMDIFKKAQKLFEISQNNIKILQLKNKLERKYVKIGYSVYNKLRKDGLEKLKDNLGTDSFKMCCKEIDELNNGIKKIEKELDELKNEMKCYIEETKDCIEEKLNEKKEKHCKHGCDQDGIHGSYEDCEYWIKVANLLEFGLFFLKMNLFLKNVYTQKSLYKQIMGWGVVLLKLDVSYSLLVFLFLLQNYPII